MLGVNKFKVMQMRGSGRSLREIGEELEVSYVTVRNILNEKKL